MRGELQGAVTVLVGILTLRLSLTRLYLDFVRPGMRPFLIASGAVLVLLGAVAFLRASRGGSTEHTQHGEHHHAPRAAWLLIAPVLALMLITPSPLGAFAAGRQANMPIPPSSELGPLPDPIDGAVDLMVSEYVERAFYDERRSLDGIVVRLTGFVSHPLDEGVDFYLNRFVINCCAADARLARVAVAGAEAPPVESWVTVTGTWIAAELGAADDPGLRVESVTPVPKPNNPYEAF